ncbi:hypothetical protein Y032_0154g2975 [Ancylostoma ceylanicum]|uniref:Uncharacterized protein n=1 Tax=Ancylostoma ceylanicum TaxID=53326 RepID=A0A016SZ22_9BILA|nr:hypothetical protein Y032_0154g2975 [Ancylostoma ceylanicum]
MTCPTRFDVFALQKQEPDASLEEWVISYPTANGRIPNVCGISKWNMSDYMESMTVISKPFSVFAERYYEKR